MKKHFLISVSLFSLLTFLLLNCGKKKEDPTPGGTNTGGNNTSLTITAVNLTSGTVGTKVVITGTGFSATLSSNTVKFGSIAAILDSATTTRLVTKVPKDATTGKITVEVGGKTATSSSDFSITQAPPTFSGTGSTANVPVTVTTTTASIATTIDKEGSKTIVQHGHVWSSTKSEPTLREAATEGKTELGAVPANATFPYKFTSDLKDLDPATTYNIRAYVKTNEGTTYGPVSQVQSKKPCMLAGIQTSNDPTSISFNSQFQVTAISNKSTNHVYTYNTEGFLTIFQSKTSESTTTQKYEYTQGRLHKLTHKYELPSISLTSEYIITYEYDTQGRVSKEAYVTGTTTIDYIYKEGTLTEVLSNVPNLKYTVKDGNIIKYESAASTINYEYDNNRNLLSQEDIRNGQKTIYQYKYDNRANFKFSIFGFKGWLPQQIIKAGFYSSLTNGGNGYNNHTETVYQYSNTNGEPVINTSRYIYTYDKSRTLGYSQSFVQTTAGKVSSSTPTVSFTINYTGDCDN